VFPARVVEVAIASPDSTERFRTAIGHALNWWNRSSAERTQIVLLPSDEHHRCDVVISLVDPIHSTVNQVLRDIVDARGAGKLALAWLIAESPPRPDHQAKLDDLVARLTKEEIPPRDLGYGTADFDGRLNDAVAADLTPASLGPLLDRLEVSASASQVTICRTPVPALGPHIFAVTVANHSPSLAIDLKVNVDAVDSAGDLLPNGACRSSQLLADVFAKLRVGPSTQQQLSRMDLLAAHTTLDFPRWLRSGHRASALYEVDLSAAPHVCIEFEDQSGAVWSRTNDEEPQRISEGKSRCP
jgi:hypothetical protein